jgi:hypothetical protein
VADRATTTYPPLGDDARYDAILARGRVLRRRRRAGVGLAGAGGAMAAAALVVVLFAATGPSDGDSVVADQDVTTTVAPSTDTTAEILGGKLPVQVVVEDPIQPVAAEGDAPAQQCIMATLTDPSGVAVAEGFVCRSSVQNEPTTVDALLTSIPPDGAQIGCGAAALSRDPDTPATSSAPQKATPATSTFRVEPPAGLEAGTYTLRIEATSGIGDGCPGPSSPGSTEDEHQADARTAEVVIP